MNLADRLQEVLDMNKKVQLEWHGRPDCKNCSLAETIEPILHDAREAVRDAKPRKSYKRYVKSSPYWDKLKEK